MFHPSFQTIPPPNSIAFYLQRKLGGIKKRSTKCSHLLSGGDIQMQLKHLSQRPIFAGPFSFTFPLLPLLEPELFCSILQRRRQQKCNVNHFVLLMASLDNESVILDWERYCSNAISSASITELGFQSLFKEVCCAGNKYPWKVTMFYPSHDCFIYCILGINVADYTSQRCYFFFIYVSLKKQPPHDKLNWAFENAQFMYLFKKFIEGLRRQVAGGEMGGE